MLFLRTKVNKQVPGLANDSLYPNSNKQLIFRLDQMGTPAWWK